MTRLPIAATLVLLAGTASGQTPARQSDLAPAAPTARSGLDAGTSYAYPPDTGKILQPANRTPYDSTSSGADANTKPVPGSTSPTTAR